jgi:hypothetical protein
MQLFETFSLATTVEPQLWSKHDPRAEGSALGSSSPNIANLHLPACLTKSEPNSMSYPRWGSPSLTDQRQGGLRPVPLPNSKYGSWCLPVWQIIGTVLKTTATPMARSRPKKHWCIQGLIYPWSRLTNYLYENQYLMHIKRINNETPLPLYIRLFKRV